MAPVSRARLGQDTGDLSNETSVRGSAASVSLSGDAVFREP